MSPIKNIEYLVFTTLLLLLNNSCCKEDKFMPLYINNLKIEKIDGERSGILFNAKYLNNQVIECEIENNYLVVNDLKIAGIGAFYDGNINLNITTNKAWIDEEFQIIPYKIWALLIKYTQ